MIQKENNSTLATLETWVDNGLSVDGIPFIHRLDDWTFFMWEQTAFDIAICTALCYILYKILNNTEAVEKISNDIENILQYQTGRPDVRN